LSKLGRLWSTLTNSSVNPVNLFADLEEFVHDHRHHGPLTADATEPACNGYRLTEACPCGVLFERSVTPEDTQLDLILSARAELTGGLAREAPDRRQSL
jgi:hypothetical protein